MLAFLFVLFAVAVRLLPHPFNLTPVGAALLFFGARGARRHAWIPVLLLAATDVYLTVVRYAYPFTADHFASFAWYAAVIWMGMQLRRNTSVARLAGASLLMSISFFLVSNFASWAVYSDMYPRSLQGVYLSYVAGLPFFRRELMGDLFFTAVFFSIPAVVHGIAHMVGSKSDHAAAA